MVKRSDAADATADPLRVVLIDNDADVAEVVSAILTDEGYAVTTIDTVDQDALLGAIGRLEPDCMLLDSADGIDFGESWTIAASLAARSRSVPVVMFTAHSTAVEEARAAATERAKAAKFAAILEKPFNLDRLLEAVETATGRSQRFDRSEAADGARTRELVKHLRAAGATDIRPSQRREWATFASPVDDRIYQLYWWQRLGRYIVGRYDDNARLELVGHFFERTAAIESALASPTG